MWSSILISCNTCRYLPDSDSASRGTVSGERGHHGLHRAQFVSVDGMAHTWVESGFDVAAESLQDFGGLLDSLLWNVRVHITASQKNRCIWESSRGNHVVCRRDQ